MNPGVENHAAFEDARLQKKITKFPVITEVYCLSPEKGADLQCGHCGKSVAQNRALVFCGERGVRTIVCESCSRNPILKL
jgi:hypothetical protein